MGFVKREDARSMGLEMLFQSIHSFLYFLYWFILLLFRWSINL